MLITSYILHPTSQRLDGNAPGSNRTATIAWPNRECLDVSGQRPSARSFRDLIVWQKARVLVQATYALTVRFPAHERYGLASQMQRAAVSVPSNIAEGWGRGSRPELHHRATIAKGSLNELASLLDLAEDLGYLSATDLAEAQSLMDEVGRMLTALRHSLKSRM